jgi:hypothetical protein
MSLTATFVEAGVRHSAVIMGLTEGGHMLLKVKGERVPVRIRGHDDVGKVFKVVVRAWTGLDVGKSIDDING